MRVLVFSRSFCPFYFFKLKNLLFQSKCHPANSISEKVSGIICYIVHWSSSRLSTCFVRAVFSLIAKFSLSELRLKKKSTRLWNFSKHHCDSKYRSLSHGCTAERN